MEPVTIAGGGLGGLVLARVLHVHGIPNVVYESDASPTARAQGGMLDIHAHDGQSALRDAQLFQQFEALILPGRQSMRVLDQDGTVLLDQADDGFGQRPEVMRGELRRILLDSLPPGTVRWGHKISIVRSLGEGRHELTFTNGGTVSTDLLVGADGAWSRVRPLLSAATPEYTGTSFIETFLFNADTRHAASARAVGGGSLGAPSKGKAIMAHREAGDTLHSYIMLARPLEWFDSINFDKPAAAAERIAREFEGWAPELIALITDGDIGPMHRPHYALPAGHRWERTAGVTLIGDAAHLTAPNGEGANLAMFDGAELGKALAKHLGNADAALADHEHAMFLRSAKSADVGDDLYEKLMGDNPAHKLIEMLVDS
jgi:2-polyprenyl-6-methoxyphenol hydroxylase-like FAD-dependent oxidoreductase